MSGASSTMTSQRQERRAERGQAFDAAVVPVVAV